MKSHARAVVIGGGVVGVATLYHLARKGWSDVMLIERKELTSGSTWHAAGLLPLFNMSYSVGQIHKYSVNFYKGLGEELGEDIGLRQVSNIRLAMTQDRMDEYHQYAGVAQTIGVEVEFLTPDQVSYPPPTLAEPTPLPTEITPTPLAQFPEPLPLPVGQAAILFDGDIWLLHADGEVVG